MDREPKVDEIVQPYCKLISETPELISLLYDIDMMPEQTVTVAGAIRLAALCEVWKRRNPISDDFERLRAALEFYADPESYHAISIMADPPCGEFGDDFTFDEEYGRHMPGKRAREALASG